MDLCFSSGELFIHIGVLLCYRNWNARITSARPAAKHSPTSRTAFIIPRNAHHRSSRVSISLWSRSSMSCRWCSVGRSAGSCGLMPKRLRRVTPLISAIVRPSSSYSFQSSAFIIHTGDRPHSVRARLHAGMESQFCSVPYTGHSGYGICSRKAGLRGWEYFPPEQFVSSLHLDQAPG